MTARRFGGKAKVLVFSLLLASSACKKRELAAAPASIPVPARPAELLAELCVPRPSELWPALQALLGPPVTFLPKAPELGFGGWLSLSPLVASSLDLHAPLVAAALGGAEPALVLGVHLQSGPEFVAQLTTGNAPTHRVERASGLALLTSLKSEGGSVLAVVGDALVAGPRAGVVRAGAYVARVMLPRASEKGPVTALLPGEALRAVGVPALRAGWQARRAELVSAQQRAEAEHGRPADFAEPGAILAAADQMVESSLALLSSAEKVTAELSADEQSLELIARLWPSPTGLAEQLARSLPLGKSDVLKALPARTVVGLVLRRAAEVGSRDPASVVRALLGARLSEKDERALGEALTALDSGRGEVQALALLDDFSVIWRGEVRDAALLRRGIESTLPWFTKQPLLGPVTALLGRPVLSQSAVRVEGSDVPASRALFRLTPVPAKGEKPAAPRELELTSLVEARRFVVAGAMGAPAPLGLALAAERGEASLGSDAQVTRWLDRSPEVAWLAFADVGRLFPSGAAAPGPLLVELTVSEGKPEFAARVSGGALRALLARGLGR